MQSIYNLCFSQKTENKGEVLKRIQISSLTGSVSLILHFKITSFYTPGIYADGYIVFVFPFVCSYVR